ncbi:unnamed protein product [Ambrosiozyma monospora]|uniref:Unnamed protein product n=1 Tax=Ambrosiozyma monospora TaxID=43982 RepID=A0A9W6YYH5_AMBMO|nr:unnamed protein product [Ambrosiozyma monospora]
MDNQVAGKGQESEVGTWELGLSHVEEGSHVEDEEGEELKKMNNCLQSALKLLETDSYSQAHDRLFLWPGLWLIWIQELDALSWLLAAGCWLLL